MAYTHQEFHVVLPSNSSMQFRPNNKTTSYVTHLPQPLNLHGRWGVALTEIHIPMTFLHVRRDNDNYVRLLDHTEVHGVGNDIKLNEEKLPHGIYENLTTLIRSLNDVPCLKNHITVYLSTGGYACIKRTCGNKCLAVFHVIHLAPTLRRILGFSHDVESITFGEGVTECTGTLPAALSRALPQTMYVYTDICESYITGDVHTPLLRVVPLDIDEYKYGSLKIKTFPTPVYVPLSRAEFQTIEIDIRDEYGEVIPFEHGTLTTTLHFKRLD